jgi:hypothetical protein
MASMIIMPTLSFFSGPSEACIKRCLIDGCGYDAASQVLPEGISMRGVCDASLMGH